MKYLFAIAGIPNEVFRSFQQQQKHISRESEFIARPFDGSRYRSTDADYYLRAFSQRLDNDHHNALSDTGIALLYIENARLSPDNEFLDAFFPAVLTVPVNWELNERSVRAINESKNNLIEHLTDVVRDTKNIIKSLKKEITEKSNRTPLLLPLKNFNSDVLKNTVQELQYKLISDENKAETIAKATSQIRRAHPPQRINGKPSCYVDNRNIQFHAPGRNLHGINRYISSHPFRCFLASRRRLGTPFRAAFHYDCIKGNGNLEGYFWGCHEGQTQREGNPHLNIAPNDYVR